MLWVQILSTPFFGMSTVVGSVLQAARRYEFIPRLEMAIVVARFGLLWLGYWTGAPFLAIVVGQVAIQIGLSLGPALWVMVKELGYRPHFRGATRSDYAAMMHISVYMALMQWSVVLADKVDTTVLGYALRDARRRVPADGLSEREQAVPPDPPDGLDPGLPGDAGGGQPGRRRGSRRAWSGSSTTGPGSWSRLLAPVTLLAGIYASPFLSLWVGPQFAPYAWMLQLFLVATLPLVLSVVVQMAIGDGEDRGRGDLEPGRGVGEPPAELLPDHAAWASRG